MYGLNLILSSGAGTQVEEKEPSSETVLRSVGEALLALELPNVGV